MKEWQKLFKLPPVTEAETAPVGRYVGNPRGPHGVRTRTHWDRAQPEVEWKRRTAVSLPTLAVSERVNEASTGTTSAGPPALHVRCLDNIPKTRKTSDG